MTNIENKTASIILNVNILSIEDYDRNLNGYRYLSPTEFRATTWVKVLVEDHNETQFYVNIDIEVNDLLQYAMYTGEVISYYAQKDGIVIITGDEPIAEPSRDSIKDYIESRCAFDLKEFLTDVVDTDDFLMQYFQDGAVGAFIEKCQ